MKFNYFNLTDRPFMNIPTGFSGEDGNIIKLSPLFFNTMQRAGYPEEAQYFGGSNIMNIITKVGNMDYAKFIKPLIVSMVETNVEIEQQYEDSDEDIVIVRRKKTREKGENYLGRNELFYATENNFNALLVKNYENFLSKDKLGMTILDHYLLSDKIGLATLALQYMYINKDKEEYKEVLNNNVLDCSVIDMFSQKNIELSMYISLLRYSEQQDPAFIDQTIKDIEKVINTNYKEFIKGGYAGNFLDSFQAMKEIAGYKPENVEFVDKVFSHVWSNFMCPGSKIYEELKKSGQHESLIKIEKKYLNIQTILFTEEIQADIPIRVPPQRL